MFIIKETLECKRRRDIRLRKTKAMQWFLNHKTRVLLSQLNKLIEISINADIDISFIRIDLIAKTYTLQYIKNSEVKTAVSLSNDFKTISDDIILESTSYSDDLPTDFMNLNEGINRVLGLLATTVKVIELYDNKNMKEIIRVFRGESFLKSIDMVVEILSSLECLKKESKDFPEFIEVKESIQNLKDKL
ncbi:hypothetical protein [Arsenophonus nasoniae]|uniref:Uncharacterized protein n=1 Tax=Arsenophonus nasoniae TaxID=638 RepID=A0AA95GHK9_9GAMM|nr:hypothetical protein [Arsenophonus nasoniae]WGL96475.1 hypothetical protein QE207_08015 [Arsenophonus nasoniae]